VPGPARLQPVAPLHLTGLCSVPVVSAEGDAGVVAYLVPTATCGRWRT
jgi:hypothetical protein